MIGWHKAFGFVFACGFPTVLEGSAILTHAPPKSAASSENYVAVKLPGVKRAYFEAIESAGAGTPAPGRWTGSAIHNWARAYGGISSYLWVTSPGPLGLTEGRRFTIIGHPVWRAQDTFRNRGSKGEEISSHCWGANGDRQATFLGHFFKGKPSVAEMIDFLEKQFSWIGAESVLDGSEAAAALGLPEFEFPAQKAPSKPEITPSDEDAIRQANPLDTALWDHFSKKGPAA